MQQPWPGIRLPALARRRALAGAGHRAGRHLGRFDRIDLGHQRSLHGALRGQGGLRGAVGVLQRKGVAGVFHVVRVGGRDRPPVADIDGLEQLVIGRAQGDLAVEGVELEPFHRAGDLQRLGAVRLGHGGGEQRQSGVGGGYREVLLVLVAEAFLQALQHAGQIGVAVIDQLDAPGVVRADFAGRAQAAGVEGVEIGLEPALLRRLDEQGEVGAPVGGDDAVGLGGLYLGDIGRKVFDLPEGHEIFAHDLDVGPFERQHFTGVLRHLMAEGIVLLDEIDPLDLRPVADVVGHRLQGHGHAGLQRKVPEAAVTARQRGIDRGVVEIEHFLAGMAGVVTAHRFRESNRRARSVALQHIADALIHRGLQCIDRSLHRALVVEGHDLEAHPGGVAAVDSVGHELPALQLVLPHCGEGAGERVDESELDGGNLPRMHWRGAEQ